MDPGGKVVAFAVSLLMLTGLLAYLSTRGPNDSILIPYLPTGQYLPTIRIGNTPVKVTVADTEEKRVAGLSGFDSLPPKQGMWFVFDKEGDYGIWMKDMRFAIDIIWVSESGRIVGIAEHATPESYPKVFTSSAPARYILEVSAGFIEQYNISAQDDVNFNGVGD